MHLLITLIWFSFYRGQEHNWFQTIFPNGSSPDMGVTTTVTEIIVTFNYVANA